SAKVLGGKSSKKGLIIAAVVLLLIALGVSAYFLFLKKDSSSPAADSNQAQESVSQQEADTDPSPAAIVCEDGHTAFADSEFGAAFCFPSDWGTASVEDAKLDTSDTGYR